MRDLWAWIGRKRASVCEPTAALATCREVVVVGAHDALAGGTSHLDTTSSTEVRCRYGAVLADRIDGMLVVIDGVAYQFRLRTDTLTYPGCGDNHAPTSAPVRDPAQAP
jgi:hypothetical protein